MNERMGIIEERQAIAAKYARFIAPRQWQAAKIHTITVDCAKPEERTVEEGEPVIAKPLAPLWPLPAPAPFSVPIIDDPRSVAAVQQVFLAHLTEADYRIDGQPYGLMELKCERRSRAYSWPRQVCMDLVRRLCPASLPKIGKAFGGKDHTTVMCAVKRTPHHLAEDPLLAGIHAKVLAHFEAQK